MNDQSRQGDAANPDKAVADARAAVAGAGLAAQGDFVRKIVEKIKGSENILIALSKNPSVDEMAAAIGLSLFLDEMQKHTTAIYSGTTPDALAFLRPDSTFETNTSSLQDFIIALNKEKADHLRYKLDGDFVKVYITPYKTSITEDDLTFSQGDYNVDFVIALNVRSAGDLDEALAEHGRIMHDASTVDITTGTPGRFGEIEWSNPAASSVCEMVTELIFALQGNSDKLDSEVATALLTGIVAATNRFSNNRTTPETLTLASKLMTMGADQQLITANVVGNEIVQNRPEGPSAAEIAASVSANAGAFADTPVVGTAMGGVGVVYDAGLAGRGSLVNYTERGDGLTAAEIAARAGITNPTPAMPINAEGTVVAPVLPGATSASGDGGSAVGGAAVSGPKIGPAQSGGAFGGLGVPGASGVSGTSGTSGADANSGTGAAFSAPADPSVMTLPGLNAPKVMATAEPSRGVAPQVGVKMQPPAPKQTEAVDYGQMMEQALADQGAAPMVKPVLPPLMDGGAAGTMSSGVMAGGAGESFGGAASRNAGMPASGGVPVNPAVAGAPREMPGEPVANPFNMTLPPPPAPAVTADMMPPTMPGAR